MTRLLREKGYDGPIIALTAHAPAGDCDKYPTADCDDFATKLIDRKMVIECVRQAGQPLAAQS